LIFPCYFPLVFVRETRITAAYSVREIYFSVFLEKTRKNREQFAGDLPLHQPVCSFGRGLRARAKAPRFCAIARPGAVTETL